MDKSYSPRDIETRIYQTWEAAGWFACDPSAKENGFASTS